MLARRRTVSVARGLTLFEDGSLRFEVSIPAALLLLFFSIQSLTLELSFLGCLGFETATQQLPVAPLPA